MQIGVAVRIAAPITISQWKPTERSTARNSSEHTRRWERAQQERTEPEPRFCQDVCSRVQLPAQSPSYLSSMCQLVSDNPSRRCLRSAARGDLVVPATKTICYGPRIASPLHGPATSMELAACITPRWPTVCPCISPSILKTELFTRAYGSSLARSWLLLTVTVGEHNFNYYY